MSDSSGSDDEEYESELEQSSYYHDSRGHLYLFIETLTGTSFEMRVSPFETIISIKAKLQQLEGIPVAQQHLLFNNRELPNKYSLYECGIPDGATLKLVLAMRGGPINTRKVPIHDETAKELQEAVERSKEELLDQIPEGGHVTVLVFRDGDQINLYHVLERPDGSYSPLSDSWSGTSIRNLFAEPDDQDVQQRIKENANTMSKMQDIKNKMENLNIKKASVKRQNTLPQETRPRSKGKAMDFYSSQTSLNLPPIRRTESISKDWDQNSLDFRDLTSLTQIQNSSNHHHSDRIQRRRDKRDSLPKVRERKSTIDFSETPPLANKNSNRILGTPLSSQRSSMPSTNDHRNSNEYSNHLQRTQNPRKLISLDVGEFKKTVDDNDCFSPTLRSHNRNRAQTSHQGKRNPPQQRDESNDPNDIFLRNVINHPNQRPTFLTSSLNEAHLRRSHPDLNNSLSNSQPPHYTQRELSRGQYDNQINLNFSDSFSVPYLNLDDVDNHSYKSSVQKHQNISILDPDTHSATPLPISSPGTRGMERRLLNSRRGRLTRPVASPSRRSVTKVLASPKGHSPRTPRSGDGKLRPTFQTRPLSGPKRKKPPKTRCAGPDCRKKLNITNSFTCRCERLFCALHRHPEAHTCTFDYKTEGRKLLETNNPMITVPKLPKI